MSDPFACTTSVGKTQVDSRDGDFKGLDKIDALKIMMQPGGPDAVWICADDGEQTALANDVLQQKTQSQDAEWFAETYASVLSKIELLGSAFSQRPDSPSDLSPAEYISAEVDWAAVQKTCEAIESLPLDAKESMFMSLKTFQVLYSESGIRTLKTRTNNQNRVQEGHPYSNCRNSTGGTEKGFRRHSCVLRKKKINLSILGCSLCSQFSL